MSIPADVLDGVQRQLGEVLRFQTVGGGCINHGGKLETRNGTYFLKWNSATQYKGMFKAERSGLALLRDTHTLHIPSVVLLDENIDYQWIVMEWVEARPKLKDYWKVLGEQLARLHQHTHSAFGLDHDNYIGSLPQRNEPRHSWVEFFVHERLQPQLRKVNPPPRLQKQFEQLYAKLPQLMPEERPSLLHGDLWSGNLMTNARGLPCLIDPAVYYGHREAELAFTKLFGGFADGFYDAYANTWALQNEFEGRVDVYNLYPLLVHANLFGGGYRSRCRVS